MYAGFANGKEPTIKAIETVIAGSAPLSKTMAERIEALRGWAKTRAQLATSQAKPHNHKARKIAVGFGRN